MGRHRKYDSELNRVNLYVPVDIKEYLVTASAKASIENNRNISITEYIVMLVNVDRSKSSEERIEKYNKFTKNVISFAGNECADLYNKARKITNDIFELDNVMDLLVELLALKRLQPEIQKSEELKYSEIIKDDEDTSRICKCLSAVQNVICENNNLFEAEKSFWDKYKSIVEERKNG